MDDIKDFIMSMGNVCKKYHKRKQPYCNKCPYHIALEDFWGCALDKLCDERIAEIVKTETLKFMKRLKSRDKE